MSYTRLAPRGVCAVLLLLGLLSGCGGGGSSTPVNTGPVTSAPRTVNGLQFTLTADKSVYKVGETVPMTFAVKNIGSTPVTAVGGGCNVLLKVLRNSQVVGPELGGCGTGGYTFTLGPGETKTYMLSWQQTDIDAHQVSPSTYTLQVWSTAGNINGVSLTEAQTETELSGIVQVTISS